jgi:hypothetical protein
MAASWRKLGLSVIGEGSAGLAKMKAVNNIEIMSWQYQYQLGEAVGEEEERKYNVKYHVKKQ